MPVDSQYFKNFRDVADLAVQLLDLPKDLWDWCRDVRKIVEGRPRSFDMIPMWEEIYRNQAHDMIIMGGRQVTKTTWITDTVAHLMTTGQGLTAFYVTDNERHLSEFSNQKFRQGCVEQNHLIKAFVKGGKIGKVTEMKWKTNSVFYMGPLNKVPLNKVTKF